MNSCDTNNQEPKDSIQLKIDKLRLLGKKVLAYESVIVYNQQSTLPGMTDLVICIEKDNMDFVLTYIEGLDEFVSPGTRLIIKGNGRPNKLDLGGFLSFKHYLDYIVSVQVDIDTSLITNMSNMFAHMKNVREIEFKRFDTSNVKSLDYMFGNCKYLTHIDLSKFDTSNVETMNGMFYSCEHLTGLDLHNLNLTKVKDMRDFLFGSRRLISINMDGLDTPNLLYLGQAFSHLGSLKSLDLSSLDFRNLTHCWNIFQGCSNLETIILPKHKLGIDNAEYITALFMGCTKLKSVNLQGITGNKVQSLMALFYGCGEIESIDLSNFNPAEIIVLDKTFYKCAALKVLDLRSLSLSTLQTSESIFSLVRDITLILKPTQAIERGTPVEFNGESYVDVTDILIEQGNKIRDTDKIERSEFIMQSLLVRSAGVYKMRVLYPCKT